MELIVVLFLFLLQAISRNVATAQTIKQVSRCKEDSGFLSDFQQTNRDHAFDAFSSLNATNYIGFLNSGANGGKPGDVVYAQLLCPPNIKMEACLNCVKKTTPFLKQNCRKQKERVAWTLSSNIDSCMVRYAGYSIEKFVNWTQVAMWSPGNAPNVDEVYTNFYPLARELKEIACDGGARPKFTSGNRTYEYGGKRFTIYVSVQCAPYLLKDQCSACLQSAIDGVAGNVEMRGRWSGRMLYLNCNVRFAHDNFLPKNSLTRY